MNKILLRDVYPYTLPKQPSDEKQILFIDKPKSEQYWTRQPIPDLRGMSTGKKVAYIEEEWRRLEEGLWMMINGELTWITPVHYDFLQYANIPAFGIPRYYDSQRIDFYFKDLIHKDECCYGEIAIKARRYGYTGMTLSECLHAAMADFARFVGFMSTDHKKAKASLFRPLVESFLTRPKHLRPEIYMPNGRPPQTEMRFTPNSLDDLDEMYLDLSGGMKSWITPLSTTVHGFDGFKWHEAVLDEIYKWTKTSVYNTWTSTKETLAVGGRVVGKAHLFATMGDDETMEAAVKDGIKLWGESDYFEKDKFGFTASGLYRWFIPAYAAYESFIDKYGKCDEAAAQEKLMIDRSKLEEGTMEYIYHVRRYPFTAEEAMSSVQNTTMFSALRLNARLQKIYIITRSEPLYTVGYFDDDAFSDNVRFVPDSKGYWKVAHHPHVNARNRCRRINGLIRPPRNMEGVIGNDPIRTADNVSGHISMNAAYVYQKYDYYGNGITNRLVAQLYGRDDDVDEMNRQVALASLYWGYPVMTERQITSTFDYFRLNGMIEFLLKSEYDGLKATGIWTKGQVLIDGIELIQSLIRAPKKDKSGQLAEEDLLEAIVFEELLQQLKHFSKEKSTKFDCVMALIATLIGAKQVKYTIVDESANRQKKKILSALHPVRR